MSSEILTVLEYMEKEKGIQRADMIATIVNALKTAAQKGISSGQELKIEINPKNGTLKAWAVLKVVDSVSDPKTEIHLEKAQALKPGAVLGELVEREIDPSSLGRIAAQTARQAVMQRIRQFEKDRIFDDFKDQVGNIVTGTVRRRERGDIYIDLGKAEAVMPAKEHEVHLHFNQTTVPMVIQDVSKVTEVRHFQIYRFLHFFRTFSWFLYFALFLMACFWK